VVGSQLLSRFARESALLVTESRAWLSSGFHNGFGSRISGETAWGSAGIEAAAFSFSFNEDEEPLLDILRTFVSIEAPLSMVLSACLGCAGGILLAFSSMEALSSRAFSSIWGFAADVLRMFAFTEAP
jgi:hypothetical protein